MERCEWTFNNPLMIYYHDKEWGVPLHDDLKLFEYMTLDAFQAGLSWSAILKKRENFRSAFDGFDPVLIAEYNEEKVESLLNDAGIVRNRMKIRATIKNAKAFLEIQKEFGTFDKYIWKFTNYKSVNNNVKSINDLPAKTALSDAMSIDLKKRGFSFVGSTICYAFMQAAGMVNDHTTACFRWKEIQNQL